MAEFASKGVAGSGLGLGIAGTALGVLNSANSGNGLLGGLFGGGANMNTAQNLAGLGAVSEIAKKDSEIAQLKAEKYADGVGINTFKEVLGMFEKKDDKYSELFKDLNKEAVDNRVRLAEVGCEIKSLRTEMANGFANANKDLTYTYNILDTKINNAVNMAECRYVTWAKRIDGDLLCPEKMDRYNSWEAPKAEAPATRTK